MPVLDVGATAATFALILPAELPDKTLVATLVLATRYRPWPVWVGVAAAFVVQSLVAVTAGGLLAQLPRRPVLAVTSALFATGAVILARQHDELDDEVAEETAVITRSAASDYRATRIA